MAAKQTLTVEKVVSYIKEKWIIFGASALIIFVLQLLSTKVLLSVVLGLLVAALLPSDIVKKVTKKTKETTN
jgi:Flp pilus assembly protein TadB